MTYCAMNGVEVKIPERALRPREPAPPPPSLTMSSPEVAQRMLRPRTPAAAALTGVNVVACLARVRSLKAQQRKNEARLKSAVERLKVAAPSASPVTLKTLQSQVDALLKMIEKLAAQANEAAMAAIKGGASQDVVREAAGEAPASSAAPVIETSAPAVLPDGSIVPGPDAKVTTPETGKPVAPGGASTQSSEGGMGLLPILAVGGLAWWLLRR